MSSIQMSGRTRAQVIALAQAYVQNNSTAVAAAVRAAVDMAYQEAAQRFKWPSLVRRHTSAVTTVAGQAYFHTPSDVNRLLSIVDLTNGHTLYSVDQASLADWRSGVPVSGMPRMFTEVGHSVTTTDLSAGVALELLSSGADTRDVTIRGYQNGLYTITHFTLTGASVVAAGTWQEVTDLEVSTTSSTTITLRTVAGSTTIATIKANYMSAPVYRKWLCDETPSQATTYEMIYEMNAAVSDDDDQYAIPVEVFLYHRGIAAAFQYKRNTSQAEQHLMLAERALVTAYQNDAGDLVQCSRPMPYRSFPRRW